MITIALCDDNALQLDMLVSFIADYCQKSKGKTEYKSYNSGKQLLDEQGPDFADIYILDMLMPEVNGMEVATTLRRLGCTSKIIFLTSSIEYAAASYDVNAYYYLIKPFDSIKLSTVLNNAVSEILREKSCCTLKNRQGEIKINFSDILYIDMDDRIPQYHLKDGRVASGSTLRCSFKEAVADLLEVDCFCMCGASIVINLDHISSFTGESVVMSEGSTIYPPKSSFVELKRSWKSYIS